MSDIKDDISNKTQQEAQNTIAIHTETISEIEFKNLPDKTILLVEQGNLSDEKEDFFDMKLKYAIFSENLNEETWFYSIGACKHIVLACSHVVAISHYVIVVVFAHQLL